MSLATVGKLCHEFKILRQKSNLNIDYSLGDCSRHSFDLVKVCLKFRIKCGYCNGKNHVSLSHSKRL